MNRAAQLSLYMLGELLCVCVPASPFAFVAWEHGREVQRQQVVIEQKDAEIADLRAIIEHGRQLIRERSEADGKEEVEKRTFEEVGP